MTALVNSKEVLDKKLISEDFIIGEVKDFVTDPTQWKITHLKVELSRDAAELVLGTRKGGIHNLLAVSVISSTDRTIHLKVKKGKFPIYLKAQARVIKF